MNRRSLLTAMAAIVGGLLGRKAVAAPVDGLTMLQIMDGGLYSVRNGLSKKPIIGKVEWVNHDLTRHEIPTTNNEFLQVCTDQLDGMAKRGEIASWSVTLYDGGEFRFLSDVPSFVTLQNKDDNSMTLSPRGRMLKLDFGSQYAHVNILRGAT